MERRRRMLALALAALLIATVLFSSVYVMRAANHACSGECCLVCSLIARVERLLHGLVSLLPLMAAGLALRALAREGLFSFPRLLVRQTPVHWKIRLND